MLSRLQHRDVVLRSVSAACRLVDRRAERSAWTEFRMQVVTAVSEAFNNIVLHSYAGRADGVVDMRIETSSDRITIELRDWGDSFDPSSVSPPDLDSLPESGLGVFIMKELMDIRYIPGRPNVLVLSKTLMPKPPGRRRHGSGRPDAPGGGGKGAAGSFGDGCPVEGKA